MSNEEPGPSGAAAIIKAYFRRVDAGQSHTELLTDEASYVSGAEIVVDGALSA